MIRGRKPSTQAVDYPSWCVGRQRAAHQGVVASFRALLPALGRGGIAAVDSLFAGNSPQTLHSLGLRFERLLAMGLRFETVQVKIMNPLCGPRW